MRPAAIHRTPTCPSHPATTLAVALLASLGLHAAACGGPSSPPAPPGDADEGGSGGTASGAGGASARGGAGGRGGSAGGGAGGSAQTGGASGAAGAGGASGVGSTPSGGAAGRDAAPTSSGGRDGGAVDPGPPAGAAPSLRRGINIGNVLDAPKEGAWGLKLEAEYFKLAKDAGFDHVRLPVRWSAHAAVAAPFTIAPAIFARVDFAIDQALANGLSIVIDVHHYDEIYDDPAGQRPRFVEMWKQIAARYKARPPQVVFELLNEPRKMLTTEVWNPIAAETIAAIRAIDQARDLIVEAGEYADAKELRDVLALPTGDPHLIGSFHLYAPMLFTHQGTDNAGGEYATVGVLFPGPPATPIVPTAAALEKKWVADWFTKYNAEPVATNPSSEPIVADPVRKAFTWAEKTKLRVYVGEFGVNEAADEASRVRWLTFARKEMERRGFGWAVWNMFGGFGLYDPKTKVWNEKLKAALLP